jgi:hypothetical protein
MNAKEAKALAIEKLVQHCLKLVRGNAENFQSKTVVTLNSEWDREILKDAIKSLISLGYNTEEMGCYLYIRW